MLPPAPCAQTNTAREVPTAWSSAAVVVSPPTSIRHSVAARAIAPPICCLRPFYRARPASSPNPLRPPPTAFRPPPPARPTPFPKELSHKQLPPTRDALRHPARHPLRAASSSQATR